MRILLCLSMLVLGATWASAAEKSPTRPNVVVILADDLGFSDLGCYGGEIETPTLNHLAENGLRYTQFYNTARCWPSRAALLTGHYAQAVRRDQVPGVRSGGGGTRPPWALLLPEMLKPLGYRAYHSGKWHVDGKPLENGFDRSYEIGGGQNNYFKTRGITDDEKPVTQTDDYYVTTAIADHAVRCLQDHAANHGDKPFFHYVCFTSPHFPLHALADDIAKYRERYRKGWNRMQAERYERIKKLGIADSPLPAMEREVGPPYHFPDAFEILGPGEINRPLPWDELTDEQRDFQATKMAIHAAMVDRMDREIGRIVEQLKTIGALDNTLLMFMSDNGASAEIMVRGDGHRRDAAPGSAETFLCLGPGWSSVANTPFRRHKTWVHEGGISTPLVVHWPAGIAARGELRHAPGHLVDIVPTVLEVVGGQLPAEHGGEKIPPGDGQSIAATFKSDQPVERKMLWWLHEGNRAIRVGDWKLVAAKETPWELYDLSRDRGEINNLADQQPERVQQLAALWQEKTDELTALAQKGAEPLRGKKKK